jgi:hypothetical protein
MASIPFPHGVCIDCQHNGNVMAHDTGRLAIYCPHNRAGAVMQPTTEDSPLWTIYTPISRDDFAESLVRFLERYQEAERVGVGEQRSAKPE